MALNLNIGILGHVDSGKTTLAKLLSNTASTAAFDKNPQSKERGITLDLGFSSRIVKIPEALKQETHYEMLQFTFVDCPGHASLIKTIIGGAQIIDMMVLVIDIQKGIQTQTAECLVIGELTCAKILIVINKIDTIDKTQRQITIDKFTKKIRKTMEKTRFGADIPIVPVSATNKINIDELMNNLTKNSFIPTRNSNQPFIFSVDHCFSIKGKGTICTGTVLQGKIEVDEIVEIPHIKETRKVKSMQIFHNPVKKAMQGDRVGICLVQFNPNTLERGILSQPGLFSKVWGTIIKVNRIKYFKYPIASKTKFHFTVGYQTVIGSIILFCSKKFDSFDLVNEYEYIEEMPDECSNKVFALVEFEKSILAVPGSLMIASKLDMDINTNLCRIAFSGSLEFLITSNIYKTEFLPKLKIYKEKIKEGTIQRVINEYEIIVHNLFKKESKRDLFLGMKVELSTGEIGIIESTFGQTSKVKIKFAEPLHKKTLDTLSSKGHNITLILKFKKYIYDKSKKMIQ